VLPISDVSNTKFAKLSLPIEVPIDTEGNCGTLASLKHIELVSP
jgi:hypothetical protein